MAAHFPWPPSPLAPPLSRHSRSARPPARRLHHPSGLPGRSTGMRRNGASRGEGRRRREMGMWPRRSCRRPTRFFLEDWPVQLENTPFVPKYLSF
uniref:Uncharacterized protein n=2 Tax=Aegilops tauschii subsp. strangulata TaxID=200361 RepID=A0A453R3M4_AEGTS